MRTDSECKKLISSIGWELGVSPALIATRLLDDNDKNDIRVGSIDKVALKSATEVWRDNGMPDYAHGKCDTILEEQWREKLCQT